MKVLRAEMLGLTIGAVLALSATAASATGFGERDGPRRTWTGCYIGAHAGWGWANTQGRFTNGAGVGNFPYDYDSDGGLAGLHVGCDVQISSALVIGVVGDYDWADISGSQTNIADTTGTFLTLYTHATDIDQMASVRARLGVVDVNALWYVTGGWAWAHTEHSISVAGAAAPLLTYKDDRNGWTLGAGVEKYLSPHLTGFLEYRFTRIEGGTVGPAANTIDRLSDTDVHALRFGFSFR
jgi:outer membrane immunogenic protein